MTRILPRWLSGLFAPARSVRPRCGRPALLCLEDRFAPTVDFGFAVGFGGPGSDLGDTLAFGDGVALDSVGNIYLTGTFRGTVDFDPGAGVFNLTSAGAGDAFVSKLDASGNFLWAKQLGGSDFDNSYGIAVDGEGNALVTGDFQLTADFDPGPGTFNLTSAGSADSFVSKLDPSGNFLWARAFGGSGDDGGLAIAVDAAGNVFSSGDFKNTVDFDPGAGTFNLTSAGSYEAYVSALDPSGNFLWAVRLGGTSGDSNFAIAVDAAGNVLSTGPFQGTADFDPGAGTFNLTSAGAEDVYVSKLDPSGNFLWAKRLGGTNFDDSYGITADSAGNVLITGDFNGTADFDPGPATFSLTSVGSSDSFVCKLDASGDFLWARAFGGTIDDGGLAVAVDLAGNVYTSGDFKSTVDFDPGAGTFNLTSAGSYDAYVSALDPSGNFLWAKQLGGSSGDSGYGIAVDAAANVFTSGPFQGTADFDPGPGTFNLTSAGSNDVFLCKLAARPEVTVQAPGFVATNLPFTATLTARTPEGDVNTSYTGTVHFSSTDSQAVLPDDTAFTAADAGVRSFSFTLKTSGAQTITISNAANGMILGTFSVQVNAATGLAFSQQPSNADFGSAIQPAVTVRLVDSGGHTLGNDGVAVTVGLGAHPAGATLGGTLSRNTVAGVATFNDLIPSKVGQGYTLTASAAGLTGATSSPFNVIGHGSSFTNVLLGQWNEAAGWRDVKAADLDGDGRSDVVGRTAVGQWWVGLSTGTGLVSQQWGYWVDLGWRDVNLGDFNNDGRPDVAGRTSGGQWWVAVNTGAAFNNVLFGAWNEAAGWRDVKVGDFTGDGRSDVAGRTSIGQWWVGVSTGSAFSNVQFGFWNEAAGWRDVMVGDFNGDSRLDVIGRTAGGAWWIGANSGTSFTNVLFGAWNEAAGWRDVLVGDFNGDGKLDVVGRTAGGTWWIGANTGSGFSNVLFGQWNEAAGWRDVKVADFTGDGRPDVAGRTAGGSWWVGVNTGAAFSNALFGSWNEAAGWRDVLVGDFNGDGLPDVIGRAASGHWWLARTT